MPTPPIDKIEGCHGWPEASDANLPSILTTSELHNSYHKAVMERAIRLSFDWITKEALCQCGNLVLTEISKVALWYDVLSIPYASYDHCSRFYPLVWAPRTIICSNSKIVSFPLCFIRKLVSKFFDRRKCQNCQGDFGSEGSNLSKLLLRRVLNSESAQINRFHKCPP